LKEHIEVIKKLIVIAMLVATFGIGIDLRTSHGREFGSPKKPRQGRAEKVE
jgi:hypothetical protein